MSKFPAKFLSANDVGRRFKITAIGGVKVESELIRLDTLKDSDNEVHIQVTMAGVRHVDHYNSGPGFKLHPESMVKRCDDQ